MQIEIHVIEKTNVIISQFMDTRGISTDMEAQKSIMTIKSHSTWSNKANDKLLLGGYNINVVW